MTGLRRGGGWMADTTTHNPYLTIARFSVEAVSPITIASGGEKSSLEAPLVRDPNGLPMLPATSLAGILKQALDLDDAREFLGYQDRQDGKRSAVTITDALIHWSDNRPRDGLLLGDESPNSDPLARTFAKDAPIRREHVRISRYGTVDGEGKFDRAAIPSGARFTFEMFARHGDGEAPLGRLIDCVLGGLHIGGATRSGYGALRCIAMGQKQIDLRNQDGRALMVEFASPDLSGTAIEMRIVEEPKRPGLSLSFQGEGPVMVGGDSAAEEIDSAPYAERHIRWLEGEGEMVKRYVIPGSSIKGPLRHRTAYHLFRSGLEQDAVETAIATLFGSPKEGERGGPGLLRFHDAPIADGTKTVTVPHVSIDRFTAGVRQGMLFMNEVLWKPAFQVEIDRLGEAGVEAEQAFALALADLKSGHLGIGADWGDGVGIIRYRGGDDGTT